MTRNVFPTTLVLALLLGGGCRHRPAPPAPPSVTNIVILLPNEDGGSSGSVVVSNPAGRQQLVDAYSGVTVRAADASPTAPAHVDPAEVQRLSGRTPLRVAGAVSDALYQQRLLGAADSPAATGYSFTIDRRYTSGAQAQAFQAVLDRLASLNLIAWARTPSTIEITAATDAVSWRS